MTQPYEVKARSAIAIEEPSPDDLSVDLREYFDRWLRSLESIPGPEVADWSPDSDPDIEVGVAVINGCVNGNIRARQRVVLQSQARVEGNIETPSLAISDGAVFEGACNCLEDGTEPEQPNAASPLFLARVAGA